MANEVNKVKLSLCIFRLELRVVFPLRLPGPSEGKNNSQDLSECWQYYCHQNKYRAQKLFLGINSIILSPPDRNQFGNFGTGGVPVCRDLFWMNQGKKLQQKLVRELIRQFLTGKLQQKGFEELIGQLSWRQ